MKISIKTESDLERIINRLRQAGVSDISYRRARAEILAAIIKDASQGRKFDWDDLPKFNGNFKEFLRSCNVFFQFPTDTVQNKSQKMGLIKRKI